MSYAIHFIKCHHVSPREERVWAGKWEKRREKPEQRTKARKRKKGGSVRTAATNRGKTAGTTRKTEANRKDGTQTAKEKL